MAVGSGFRRRVLYIVGLLCSMQREIGASTLVLWQVYAMEVMETVTVLRSGGVEVKFVRGAGHAI